MCSSERQEEKSVNKNEFTDCSKTLEKFVNKNGSTDTINMRYLYYSELSREMHTKEFTNVIKMCRKKQKLGEPVDLSKEFQRLEFTYINTGGSGDNIENIIDIIPDELIYNILMQYSNLQDVLNVTSVNKRWRRNMSECTHIYIKYINILNSIKQTQQLKILGNLADYSILDRFRDYSIKPNENSCNILELVRDLKSFINEQLQYSEETDEMYKMLQHCLSCQGCDLEECTKNRACITEFQNNHVNINNTDNTESFNKGLNFSKMHALTCNNDECTVTFCKKWRKYFKTLNAEYFDPMILEQNIIIWKDVKKNHLHNYQT